MADKQIYTFSNEIDEVEISSLGAKIFVQSADGSAIVAEYDNPADKPELCAVLCGKHLTLKETPTFKVFTAKHSEDYAITVKLPEKLYKELKINTASGGVEISDSAVTAETLNLNTASGQIEINAFFENAKVKSASGSVHLNNASGKTAKLLKVSTASGSVSVENYKAEKYVISSVSGKTTYTGASGEGEIRVTSGTVEVGYDEWNGDLKIGAISGNVKVTLPAGSGVNVVFDGVSGMVKTDLGGEAGRFINLGKGTNGEFGGENKHNASVNTVSGTVTFAQCAE